ncbi:MAG: two-component system sensor histidine kinase NtrB [Thermodesulfobacteriota bacterium]
MTGIPQNEFKTILNGIRDFILIISPDQKILEVNDVFLKRMGYRRQEVIGKPCYEVFQRVTRKSSNCLEKCPLDQVIQKRRHCQVELSRVDQRGKTWYTELTIFPIWEKKGKIHKFIEISRDITQRKADEKKNREYLQKMVEERTRQLKESHEKLLHQDKMASLGKLSSSVVHEINNPVAGILNLVLLCKRILKEDAFTESQLDLFSQYLDLMETETRRVTRITGNLLAFARQSKIEVTRFDVNELMEQTLMLNANLLRINKIRIIEDLEQNLPLIRGSEDQIQQVIMNLISNAVESMAQAPRKRLTLKTCRTPDRQAVKIQIKDTGAGIPKAYVSKIFEPFFSTKKKGKGVGLGLSVVYGIIEEHRGKMYVDSTEGQGTCFTITLQTDGPP